jgi:hypothetical protein
MIQICFFTAPHRDPFFQNHTLFTNLMTDLIITPYCKPTHNNDKLQKKKIPTPNLKNPPANFTNLESQIANPNGFDPFDPTTTKISFEIHFLLHQSVNHVESFNPATPKTTLSKERPKPNHCKTHPRKPTHNKPSILTTHNRSMKLGFSVNRLVCKNGF